jgi:CheY-like chemotaxis protein
MQSPVKPPWTNTVGVASLRVLVAEDNAVNRKLATRLLEKRGHRVWSAGNGIEALASLRRDEFDAVLMAIQMPEMDGVEAVARWRVEEAGRGRGRLPIIALTANAMAGDEERYRAAGMDGVHCQAVRAVQVVCGVGGIGWELQRRLKGGCSRDWLPHNGLY